MEITLSGKGKGLCVLVDHEDRWVDDFKWYLSKTGYAYSMKLGLMHRAILSRGIEDGLVIDHKNGDKLDNRRENLRWVTYQQNNIKRKPRNPSGLKGVRRGSTICETWQARITVNGEGKYLGSFACPEDAARCYDAAARENFGDFAITNFKEQ